MFYQALEMENRSKDKGRKSREENVANLEEAMQKEREPVGEHFLGHGFCPAKERGSVVKHKQILTFSFTVIFVI